MHRFLKAYDIYFLVILNPDGYDFSRNLDSYWRKNLRNIPDTYIEDCFGVDLNRSLELFKLNNFIL